MSFVTQVIRSPPPTSLETPLLQAVRVRMSAGSSPSSLVPPPPVLPSSPPELPVEMIQHILKFADARALALCCQGNFALLELASKLLYGTVQINGEHKLIQMFCSRNRTSLPRLEPLLSLSRITSFTVTTSSGTAPPAFSSDRVLHDSNGEPVPIKVHLLVVQEIYGSQSQPPPEHSIPLTTALFPLLNPTLFHFVLLPPSSPFEDPDLCLTLDSGAYLNVWDRLTYVKLVDTSFENRLNTWKHFSNTSSWSVSYELSKPFNTADSCSAEFKEAFLDLTKMSLKDSGWFPNQKINRAEVVVQSEEERVEIEKYFRSLGRIYLGEPGELDERMEKVTFVCRKIHS